MLTDPAEVQHVIRGLKISKAPDSDGIPNRALKHLPQPVLLLLVALFNAILRTQYFPPIWKHVRVISILNSGKDPALPSSYRPISLLDTIGMVFEKILLSRILSKVNERGLLRDEQFGFRHKHSTSLQMTRFVERVFRNFGEKRLTGGVFLDVAKAFDAVWVDCLAYKLMALKFPLTGENHSILPAKSNVRSVLPSGYFLSPPYAGWRGTGVIDLPSSKASMLMTSTSPHATVS
jgi:hypothetical protein